MKPVLQALVLADRVYTDTTGKKIIAGTFNKVLFKHPLPVQTADLLDGTKQLLVGGMQAGAPWAYLSITDVVDGTELTLQFVNLSKNAVLFETRMRVDCKDRLQTIEIVAPLPRLPFSSAGTYALEVVCEGEVIGSHRIIASELP